jgi:D-alanyl-D-alanine carboxypeptidase (penicillin-binding protein 5/6)
MVTAAFPSGQPKPPTITARAAILIDADTGEILYSHNANARVPMASTTKIMTAMLALESLDLDTKVKVSANAVAVDGSKASLQKGEVLTVEQLLYALLVVSGNDASVALAEATAGSVPAFVEKMNEKAKALGLTNTHFVNPNGLNNKKHFSSAKDLSTLARYALQNLVFRRIVNTTDFALPTLKGQAPRKFKNQNVLLRKLDWVTGVKTGSTPYAHYCVVASGTVEGVSLIAVVLGAAQDDVRWSEAQALLEYGFSLNPNTILVERGQLVAQVDVPDYLGRKVRLVADRTLTVRLSRTDAVTGSAWLDRDPTFPVHVGEMLGTIDFTLNGKALGSANLIAAQAIEKPTLEMILEYWRAGLPPQLKLDRNP